MDQFRFKRAQTLSQASTKRDCRPSKTGRVTSYSSRSNPLTRMYVSHSITNSHPEHHFDIPEKRTVSRLSSNSFCHPTPSQTLKSASFSSLREHPQTTNTQIQRQIRTASRLSSSGSSSHRSASATRRSINQTSQLDNHGTLLPPEGFDLATYVHKHGTASGIRIGQNGQSTNDKYFKDYLLQCEAEIDTKEKSCSELVENDSKEFEELTELKQGSVLHKKRETFSVPLCWEDQLSKVKPYDIKRTNNSLKITQQGGRRPPDGPIDNRSSPEDIRRLTHLKEKVFVSVTVGEGIDLLSSSSYKHQVYGSIDTQSGVLRIVNDPIDVTIPKTLRYQERKPMAFESQQCHLNSTAISLNSSTPASVTTTTATYDVRASENKTNSHMHSPTDIIYNHVPDQHFPTKRGQLNFKQPSMLYILLSTSDPDVQEELEQQTYDVLFTTSPVSSFPLLTKTSSPQNTTVLTNVGTGLFATRLTVGQSVIRVDLRDEYLDHEQMTTSLHERETKLTVFFVKPRSMFFNANLSSLFVGLSQVNISEADLDSDSETELAHGSHCERIETLLSSIEPIETVLSSITLEDSYKERTGYCDQDDDEDRTDMEVVSQYFPDLSLTNIANEEQPAMHASFSSPLSGAKYYMQTK